MSADGVFRNKKRGRKSKAEKEREKEDAARGDMRSSVDAEGSVRAGATGGGGGDDADDDEDFEDEGELLGREEGATDTEAEKKNLAYVSCLSFPLFVFYFLFFIFLQKDA
jgi:transcription initiation factor TFIID subunit 11